MVCLDKKTNDTYVYLRMYTHTHTPDSIFVWVTQIFKLITHTANLFKNQWNTSLNVTKIENVLNTSNE